jgi:hypothetical protein
MDSAHHWEQLNVNTPDAAFMENLKEALQNVLEEVAQADPAEPPLVAGDDHEDGGEFMAQFAGRKIVRNPPVSVL